jgi:hypothetical protein
VAFDTVHTNSKEEELSLSPSFKTACALGGNLAGDMIYTLTSPPGKGLQAFYRGAEPLADNRHAKIHEKLLMSRAK